MNDSWLHFDIHQAYTCSTTSQFSIQEFKDDVLMVSSNNYITPCCRSPEHCSFFSCHSASDFQILSLRPVQNNYSLFTLIHKLFDLKIIQITNYIHGGQLSLGGQSFSKTVRGCQMVAISHTFHITRYADVVMHQI